MMRWEGNRQILQIKWLMASFRIYQKSVASKLKITSYKKTSSSQIRRRPKRRFQKISRRMELYRKQLLRLSLLPMRSRHFRPRRQSPSSPHQPNNQHSIHKFLNLVVSHQVKNHQLILTKACVLLTPLLHLSSAQLPHYHPISYQEPNPSHPKLPNSFPDPFDHPTQFHTTSSTSSCNSSNSTTCTSTSESRGIGRTRIQ